MIVNIPTTEDLRELAHYALEGDAKNYHGMSYADGIMAVVEWLEGNAPRPDLED